MIAYVTVDPGCEFNCNSSPEFLIVMYTSDRMHGMIQSIQTEASLFIL